MRVVLLCLDLIPNGKWILIWLQQWHPDKWTRTPSLLGEAKRKFQQIQEAYSGKLYIFNFIIRNGNGNVFF